MSELLGCGPGLDSPDSAGRRHRTTTETAIPDEAQAYTYEVALTATDTTGETVSVTEDGR